MNLEPYLEQIRKVCRQSNISRLCVFGSVARGDDTSESDVDLLVKFDRPVSLLELIKLEDKFVDIFGRKVDLGTEGGLHPLIRDSVMKDLKILWFQAETRV